VPRSLPVHIALLRGVNVGGKNKLPMKDLAALFEAAGCERVRTYIQSGNVVCAAPAVLARGLPAAVARDLERRFGLRVPVVMRTAAEMERVAAGNPFLAAGTDPAALHVAFLGEVPEKGRAAGLDPGRSPPDELALRGREVYLRLPSGTARSRITNAWLDAVLGTFSTIRNWRTVLQLLEMARS
jgi:uncharacterized protein (DUF1697 family)